jgi:hypothetical protein
VFLLSLVTATSAFSESLEDLSLGTRIRVTTASTTAPIARSSTVTGSLTHISDSTLVLGDLSHRGAAVISREEITRIERMIQGRQRGKGALYGFFIGAGFGAIAGFASGDDPSGMVSLSAETKAGFGALVFGALGTLIGLLVAPGERWQEVELDPPAAGLEVSADHEYRLQIKLRF